MSGFLAVLSRELRAYFFSPMAWVILTFFLIGNGVIFSVIVSFLSDPRAGGTTTPLQAFFGGFFYWLVLLVFTPVITMRLISEERRSGTIEMLMTSPVSEGQVVLAKFTAALGFYLFLWLPTLVYVGMVARSSEVDWGPVAAGYLGVLGIGSVFISIGLFGSTFAKSQIVAAVATFGVLLLLFLVPFVKDLVGDEAAKSLLGYVDLYQHMEDFGKGIVDSRRLVYYVSVSGLFLFLSARALEAKKWR